jgi:uncharacterized repeat protein (TIGR01451 family)
MSDACDAKEVVMKTLMSVFLLFISISAAAMAEGTVDIRTVVQKEEVVINDEGESVKRLVDADVVIPGETVFYTITFRNVGDEPADDVVITNPIADSLVYVDGSAFGPGTDIQFSVDGGASFAAADELTVVENGIQRKAAAGDYTHVRWVMNNELAAGAQATARFAAVLE